MLGLTPVLLFVVSIRDLDGSTYQSPNECKEFDASVQPTFISRRREVTRRLNIFESITNSDYRQNDDLPMLIGYKEECPSPEDDKKINEILQYSLVELSETLRTLKSNDPSKAMRIPVHVTPVQTSESLMVFESLLEMLSNPKESRSPPPWQQYLMDSISNEQCSVRELCREFQQNFKCDQEGRLMVVLLDCKGPFSHLNLLMIPNTVNILSVRGIKLKTISEWTDLREKSLKVLRVDGNANLELNLDGLTGNLNYLRLEYLSISTRSISKYIGATDWQRALPKIGEWMKTSTLNSLRLRHRIKTGNQRGTRFHSDGSWTLVN